MSNGFISAFGSNGGGGGVATQGTQGTQGLQGVQGIQAFGATGYFADVIQTNNQTATTINTNKAYQWGTLETNGFTLGTSILSNDTITATNTGRYTITARFNFVNTDSVAQSASISSFSTSLGALIPDGQQKIIVPANGNAELIVTFNTNIVGGSGIFFFFSVSSLLVSINTTPTNSSDTGANSTCNISLVIGVGTQGVQGRQGTQGVQGTTGSQGVQGTQGIIGENGASGGLNLFFNQSIASATSPFKELDKFI